VRALQEHSFVSQVEHLNSVVLRVESKEIFSD
jgi:hypothetical protein